MRDDNLEVGVTLRGWIHWFISKDDCRARRYDFPRLGQKLGRQPAFLRRQEEAFIRAVLCQPLLAPSEDVRLHPSLGER